MRSADEQAVSSYARTLSRYRLGRSLMRDPMWMSGDNLALGIDEEEDEGIDIPDPEEDDE